MFEEDYDNCLVKTQDLCMTICATVRYLWWLESQKVSGNEDLLLQTEKLN